MIKSEFIEIHAVSLSSMGGMQILENFVKFYGNKKIKLWVKTRQQIEKLDLPKNVEICDYSFFAFMKKTNFKRVIVYMNGIVLVRPPNSDTILFIQNALYFSKYRSLSLRGKIRKAAFRFTTLFMGKNDQVMVQTNYMRNLFTLYVGRKIKVAVLGAKHPINNLHLAGNLLRIQSRSVANAFIYPTSPRSHKNNEKLVELWAELSKSLPQIPLLYLTIRQSDLRTGCDNINHNKIKFLGPLTQEELFHQLIDKVVIFVSSSETLGLPIFEAISLSRPIVILDADYSKEYENIDLRLANLSEDELIKMFNDLTQKNMLNLEIV